MQAHVGQGRSRMPRAMRRSRSRRAAAPRGFFGNPRLFCAPTSILRRSLTPNRPSS
jgi:hypothetical protein